MAAPPSTGSRPSAGEREVALAPLLWVFALAFAAVFLVLEPSIGFPVFGSDTGEYFRLSASIASTGHLPASYAGWGSAYPDFPGTFLLSAIAAGAVGLGPLVALQGAVPVVAALSVVPLFLLFRRIFPSDSVAVLGAGLATVAFPRIFSLAHPAPLALGDFLVVASLWMFVEGRRDRRWYGPLALTGAALVVTHHLSSYFFLVSALGSLWIVEMYRPGSWSRRFPSRELAFGAAFLLGMFAFWFLYDPTGTSFLPTVTSGIVGGGVGLLIAFEAGAVAIPLLMGLSVRWRRARARSPRTVRLPTDRAVVRDFAIILGGTFAGILVVTSVPLPGTSQTTTVAAVVFFAPMIAIAALGAGTRRLLDFARLGPWSTAWIAAVGGSALLAIATGDAVISPARHVEYLVIPLGLLVAVGIGRLIARAGLRWGRPAILSGGLAACLLLAANGAIAYPPPADFGGFQEGLSAGDVALWQWAGSGLPQGTVVASDHRLSSMLFGFDGDLATWDSTPALFTGSNASLAASELRASLAPHSIAAVQAVAVDGTMRSSGIALDPSALAAPMSPSASAWLGAPPFVPIYENGPEAVYWVDGPVAAVG